MNSFAGLKETKLTLVTSSHGFESTKPPALFMSVSELHSATLPKFFSHKAIVECLFQKVFFLFCCVTKHLMQTCWSGRRTTFFFVPVFSIVLKLLLTELM